jgi:hypothetical protein
MTSRKAVYANGSNFSNSSTGSWETKTRQFSYQPDRYDVNRSSITIALNQLKSYLHDLHETKKKENGGVKRYPEKKAMKVGAL